MKAMFQSVFLRLLAALRGGDVAARAMGVTVGSRCRILSLQFGSEPWLVSIGDRVTVSSSVKFLTHDGVGWLFRDERGRRYRYAPVQIGSDVFIGIGSTIMPGVNIGDKCVVGAGSVVTKSVPSGYVVAGVPARIVADYDSLMARVATWPAHSDLVGLNQRQRVDSIVEALFAADMIDERGLS